MQPLARQVTCSLKAGKTSFAFHLATISYKAVNQNLFLKNGKKYVAVLRKATQRECHPAALAAGDSEASAQQDLQFQAVTQ